MVKTTQDVVVNHSKTGFAIKMRPPKETGLDSEDEKLKARYGMTISVLQEVASNEGVVLPCWNSIQQAKSELVLAADIPASFVAFPGNPTKFDQLPIELFVMWFLQVSDLIGEDVLKMIKVPIELFELVSYGVGMGLEKNCHAPSAGTTSLFRSC